MDKTKDTMSNKKNWLVELADISVHERDFFLKFIRDHDGKKQTKSVGLEFAVVSIFYRKNRDERFMMNMRVSFFFLIIMTIIHYGNITKKFLIMLSFTGLSSISKQNYLDCIKQSDRGTWHIGYETFKGQACIPLS